jgi:mannose/fructose-specific phosphotransferase system component IIA
MYTLPFGLAARATAFLAQQAKNVRAVTGMNLPMLLETFMERMNTDKLESLAETAFSAGHTGIVDIVAAFKKFQQDKAG